MKLLLKCKYDSENSTKEFKSKPTNRNFLIKKMCPHTQVYYLDQ